MRPCRSKPIPLRWLGTSLLAALAVAVQAAGAVEPQQLREDVPDRIHQVPRASGEFAIDGELDEADWERALVVRLDYETRPGENIEPPVETECLITYDESHVYVAFRASDPEPKQIRAHLSDRDSAWDDDFVGVVFDTFNDERRAFEFFVNPLGVQMDLFNDDVNRNETSSWDAIWASKGKITESGYQVEMAIPFHQLRFPRTSGHQVWGFDAIRFYPRNQRHRIASQPMDRNLSCYLCQISKMRGFEGVSPGKNIEIVPTLTASRIDQRQDFPSGDLQDGGVDADPGITVRWGMTPNLTLNGTVNPDFSQVEADSAQLDVNVQFALFFPERRPFFLEGADFFDTPFDVVFTRNVADPDWGVKLSGKEGKNAIGVFAAQDRLTNLIFPGSQGSRQGSFPFETTDAVLRYRRDFGKNSAIGALFTGREGDGYSNLLGGIDGLYRINDKDTIDFQVLTSETEYPMSVVDEFDQPGGSFSDQAYRINYRHNSRGLDWYLRYEDVGADFRADMGFMPRVDFSFLLGGISHTWWGEDDDWYTQWNVGGDWDLTEDGAGNVLEREFEVWTEFGGPKQSWLWFDVGTRDRFFNGVTFDGQEFVNTWFEIQPTGDFWFGFFGHAGDAIDFAHTREGDVVQLEPNFRYNLGLHLRTNFTQIYQKLDVEGGTLFEANISQLKVVYQLNVRQFVRAIFQYRVTDRNPALWDFEVDDQSERLFTQLLYSYKLNPQTVLFFGYSDNRLGSQDLSLTQRDRTIFFKLGYAWIL